MSLQIMNKVLIVDDEMDTCIALSIYLQSEGFTCSMAADGSMAMQILLGDRDIAVVLLDICMPQLDGITALKLLQEADCDAAVIMMSGQGSEELAVECMRNGAEDYIAKPFSPEDILQRIERARVNRLARLEKQRLEQEKEDFILMLSHDMKNPLTAVIGSIDIIREGCLGAVNPEQKDYLQAAIDSCNEVVTMIDNLLDIRKFEAGKMQMAPQPYRATELLGKIANQFSRAARHDGIAFSVHLDPGDAMISVDRHSFNRIFGNLLGNALKFTPEGGEITISSGQVCGTDANSLEIPSSVPVSPSFFEAGHFVRITVSDTGDGIPEKELNHIFERFTQVGKKSDREKGGAGMGLAYCRLAVESFRGIIWAESQAEQGSDFIVLFPVNAPTR